MADKAQAVRLLDVFVFGPFMIAAGIRARALSDIERGGLILLGLGTMGYNWRNFKRQRALEEG